MAEPGESHDYVVEWEIRTKRRAVITAASAQEIREKWVHPANRAQMFGQHSSPLDEDWGNPEVLGQPAGVLRPESHDLVIRQVGESHDAG